MIIVAGGDSFIYGSELADQVDDKPSKSTIPALLAKSISADYVCTAEPGNANSAIARQVMAQCSQIKNDNVFIFVMWTFTHRYEFRFNYHTRRKSSPWYSINLWNIVDDVASLQEQFKSFNPEVFAAHVNDKKIMDTVGVTEFAKMFYLHVGNNEYYETYTSLKEILFLQQYLELNNIPHIFMPADTHFKEHNNYLRHNSDPSLRAIYEQINWNNWFFFPEGHGPNQTETPRGFYQWAVENKYPVGTTHPLEEAHADAAKLIKEKFDELVTKSLEQNSIRN